MVLGCPFFQGSFIFQLKLSLLCVNILVPATALVYVCLEVVFIDVFSLLSVNRVLNISKKLILYL